jgi:hypothetical protein
MVGCEGFMGGGLSKHLVGLSGEEYEAWVNVILDTAEDPHVLQYLHRIIFLWYRKCIIVQLTRNALGTTFYID